jgi:hypothetical protein
LVIIELGKIIINNGGMDKIIINNHSQVDVERGIWYVLG